MIVCRTEHPLSEDLKRKVALFCDIDPEAVIELRDAETLYEVPLMLQREGLDRIVVNHLGLECGEADMTEWQALVNKVKNLSRKTTIALVGKYVSLPDAYMSVVESLKHAGFANDTDVEIRWVNSEDVTDENADRMARRSRRDPRARRISAIGASRGKFPPSDMPGNGAFPSWASASACR